MDPDLPVEAAAADTHVNAQIGRGPGWILGAAVHALLVFLLAELSSEQLLMPFLHLLRLS